MKSYLLVLMAPLMISVNASAERVGKDERIYICESDSEAKFVQKNKKFRARVVHEEYIRLTRLSDKAWLKAKSYAGVSGTYLFDTEKSGTWTRALSGYLAGVDERGKLRVSVAVKPGHYERDILTCKLARVISEYEPLTDTEKFFDDMLREINMGNGSSDFKRYIVTDLDLDDEWAQLRKHRRKGCTFTEERGKRAVISVIKKDADDAATALKLEELDATVGVRAWIADVSDGDISCSLTHVWVYTEDGVKLEIFYDQGD